MAPDSAFLGPRGLSDVRIDYWTRLTGKQQYINHMLALISASISLLAALVSTYWFVMMKKDFRHQYVPLLWRVSMLTTRALSLIMLMIQGNLCRAIWLVTYPAVALAQGPILTESVLCQMSGFLVAFGTEAVGMLLAPLPMHSKH